MTAEVIYGVVFGKPKTEGGAGTPLMEPPFYVQAPDGSNYYVTRTLSDVQPPCDTEPTNEPA